jgi:hypothetical protein
MKIEQKPKYDVIQIQKEYGGPKLTQPNPTHKKERANPVAARAAEAGNQRSGDPCRHVRAVR